MKQLCALLPSYVVKCDLLYVGAIFFIFKKSVGKEGQNKVANLAENNALSNRQQLIQRDQDIIFVLLIPTIHVKLLDALKT